MHSTARACASKSAERERWYSTPEMPSAAAKPALTKSTTRF